MRPLIRSPLIKIYVVVMMAPLVLALFSAPLGLVGEPHPAMALLVLVLAFGTLAWTLRVWLRSEQIDRLSYDERFGRRWWHLRG
ncbi:MAG: hypothetical protein J0H01_00555 [Rhizobiales bacterium]|nr:hypothetical protein [Hyphomicrobiales bacterium]